MLQEQSVSPQLFKLLSQLMQFPELRELRLVGGTALALQIVHRMSVDIDLFGELTMDEFELTAVLKQLGELTLLHKSKNIQVYSINGIKVDLVNYPYLWLQEVKLVKGIRLCGTQDIAAMKLNAIAGRGSKKDFVDLYYLLQEYSLRELLQFYNNKYPEGSEFMVIKNLSYFEDADQEPEVLMLQNLEWSAIKKKIIEEEKKLLS